MAAITKLQRELRQRRIVLSIVTERCAAFWDRLSGHNVEVSEVLRESRKRLRSVLVKGVVK